MQARRRRRSPRFRSTRFRPVRCRRWWRAAVPVRSGRPRGRRRPARGSCGVRVRSVVIAEAWRRSGWKPRPGCLRPAPSAPSTSHRGRRPGRRAHAGRRARRRLVRRACRPRSHGRRRRRRAAPSSVESTIRRSTRTCVGRRVGDHVAQRLLGGAVDEAGGLRVDDGLAEIGVEAGLETPRREPAEQVADGRLQTFLLQVRWVDLDQQRPQRLDARADRRRGVEHLLTADRTRSAPARRARATRPSAPGRRRRADRSRSGAARHRRRRGRAGAAVRVPVDWPADGVPSTTRAGSARARARSGRRW